MIMLAFMSAIAWIKFLQVLSFSDTISLLARTLARVAFEMLNFMFIFLVIWIAFIQLMYLIFNEQLLGFASISKTMEK